MPGLETSLPVDRCGAAFRSSSSSFSYFSFSISIISLRDLLLLFEDASESFSKVPSLWIFSGMFTCVKLILVYPGLSGMIKF